MTYDERSEIHRKIEACERRYGREDQAQFVKDIREVMESEAGRRFIMGIIGRGYVFGYVYASCGDNPTRLAYMTGRREFAADIYGKINSTVPDLVLKAIQERQGVDRIRRAEKEMLNRRLREIESEEMK